MKRSMVKLCLLGLLGTGLMSCGTAVNDADPAHTNEENSSTTSQSLTKAQDPSANGHSNFCDDASATCDSGEGDCDLDSQCTGALVCGADNGANFGLRYDYDVCVPAHCQNAVIDAAEGESAIDCGGVCGACPTTNPYPDNHPKYCDNPNFPCAEGEGDCDFDSQCQPGLICIQDGGEAYGKPATLDVCAPAHCSNGIEDAAQGETGVDCGGNCAPCPDSNPLTPGASNYCDDPAFPCDHGEGDCDATSQCKPGLVCANDVGARYGFQYYLDVCVNAACNNGIMDGTETGIDCGGGCGTCPTTNPFPLGHSAYCNDPNFPCAEGEGDCDVNSHCQPGLVCGKQNGATYGLAASTDVCVPLLCDDDIIDGPDGEIGKSCGGASCSECDFDIWTKALSNNDSAKVRSIKTDSLGNIIVAGTFSGSLTLGGVNVLSGGDEDIFLVKYTSDGTYMWGQRFGGSARDEALNLAIDGNDDVALVGRFASASMVANQTLTNLTPGKDDAVIFKASGATGAPIWARSFGSSGNDVASGVAFDAAGDAYVIGFHRGDIDFGSGVFSAGSSARTYIVKLQGADGASVWAKSQGGSGDDFGKNVVIGANGKPTFAISSSSSSYAVDAMTSLPGLGKSDAVLVQLEPADGATRWSKRIGGTDDDSAENLSVDTSNNIYLTGYYYGTANFGGTDHTSNGFADAFLAKYSAAGVHSASISIGGTGFDAGESVSVKNTFVYFTGYFQDTVAFGTTSAVAVGGTDIFMSKRRTSNLNHVQVQRYGNNGLDFGRAFSTRDGIFLGGSYEGNTIDLGNGDVVGGANNNGLLIRLNP